MPHAWKFDLEIVLVLLGERYSGANWLAHLIYLNAPGVVDILEPFSCHGMELIRRGPAALESLNASDTLVLIVAKHPLAWATTMRERAPDGIDKSFHPVAYHHDWKMRNKALKLAIHRGKRPNSRFRRHHWFWAFISSVLGTHGASAEGSDLEAFLKLKWRQPDVPSKSTVGDLQYPPRHPMGRTLGGV